MRYLTFKKYILLLSIAGLALGCSSDKKIGMDIPSGITPSKLSEVLKEPAKYNDKQLVLEGNYGKCCAEGCDDEFFLKEKMNFVKVMLKDSTLTNIPEGKPIRVYGTFKTTVESPYFQAVAVEIKK